MRRRARRCPAVTRPGMLPHACSRRQTTDHPHLPVTQGKQASSSIGSGSPTLRAAGMASSEVFLSADFPIWAEEASASTVAALVI